MTDRYDVTVRRINESKDDPDPISIGQAYTVTLEEFGTLTIEAAGTIRSFPRALGPDLLSQGFRRKAPTTPFRAIADIEFWDDKTNPV